jgi:uncharacterized protein (DUF2249 family)
LREAGPNPRILATQLTIQRFGINSWSDKATGPKTRKQMKRVRRKCEIEYKKDEKKEWEEMMRTFLDL